MKQFFIIVLSLVILTSVYSAELPFKRGINLIWLVGKDLHSITTSRYTKEDFVAIKDMGFDHIRLNTHFLYFTLNEPPDYGLDPLIFDFLDQIVSWATELDIYLILEHGVGTSPTQDDIQNVLVTQWTEIAEHYKNSSPYVCYEIYNEPNGIETTAWSLIQQQVINAIRTVDSEHYIIATAAGYSGVPHLFDLPTYNDDKIIYTFHYYGPFLFTHQGAGWITPSMKDVKNIPFPYDPDRMPLMDPQFSGTWIESMYQSYPERGQIAWTHDYLNQAVQFQNERNVATWNGEWGAFFGLPEDRARWYKVVREYCEEHNIAWSMFTLNDLFKSGTNELFDHDLDPLFVNALGMTLPTQTELKIEPDTAAFSIYTDYFPPRMKNDLSFNYKTLDYYSKNNPLSGTYCIKWEWQQPGQTSLQFRPQRDFSVLRSAGFVLDFWVRANAPKDTRIILKFMDTKTDDPNDHPWQSIYSIDGSRISWDGEWHQMQIPLDQFIDYGSWDNDRWYPSEGKFDWSAIGNFVIATEHQDQRNAEFFFDDIKILKTNLAPVVNRTIPNKSLTVGGVDYVIELESYPPIFSDPENDPLTYKAVSSDSGIVLANIIGSTLRITPLAEGTTTIAITANDGNGGAASTTFPVNVHQQSTIEVPLKRGFVVTGWVSHGDATQYQFNRYSKEDLEKIKELGCDHIRLPVNLHWNSGGPPDYKIEPLLFTFLDQIITWAEEVELHLVIENGSTVNNTSYLNRLKAVWRQVAERYKDRSQYVYYEIVNEPYNIDDNTWGEMQQQVIDEIRAVDTKHTIIVGGAVYNSYEFLHRMPEYTDDNLIYTFHFYEPFLFTHQGASWTTPSMVDLLNVPYPYDSGRMPELPSSLIGSWLDYAYNDYPQNGQDAWLRERIEIAVQFKNERNVPLWCGEWGAFMGQIEDRARWYEAVRKILEENNVGWCLFPMNDIFKNGSAEQFDHDLNVELVEALGLTPFPQSEYVVTPDTSGFPVYTDYLAKGMWNASYGHEILSYYDDSYPAAGDFSIRWGNISQYGALVTRFAPYKDLTQLYTEGYALRLWIRGKVPSTTKLELRFLDTKTDEPNDHPWRMDYTVEKSIVSWDGEWHQLTVPFSAFRDAGSFDNNQWFNPAGKFDWSQVDYFAIVAEHHPLENMDIYFDDIFLYKDKTAPISTILMPESGRYIGGSSFTFQGTALDKKGDGVTQVHISTDSGDTWYKARSTSANYSTWEWIWSSYETGTYHIQSRATDLQGNMEHPDSALTVHVDITAPLSKINNLVTGETVSADTVFIQGTATDSIAGHMGIGVDSVLISFDNGKTWSLTTNSGTNFSTWRFAWSQFANQDYHILTKAVDKLGNSETPGEPLVVTNIREIAQSVVPIAFALKQNYPNPFNPVTTIAYDLPESADVTLEIYNILGIRIKTLLQEIQQPGAYQLRWDATDDFDRTVSNGVYFYKIIAHGQSQTWQARRKMMLLK